MRLAWAVWDVWIFFSTIYYFYFSSFLVAFFSMHFFVLSPFRSLSFEIQSIDFVIINCVLTGRNMLHHKCTESQMAMEFPFKAAFFRTFLDFQIWNYCSQIPLNWNVQLALTGCLFYGLVKITSHKLSISCHSRYFLHINTYFHVRKRKNRFKTSWKIAVIIMVSINSISALIAIFRGRVSKKIGSKKSKWNQCKRKRIWTTTINFT